MKTPGEHAEESVQFFGGKEEDYLPIHHFLDSSYEEKLNEDLRLALTHNDWFIGHVLPGVFGEMITNSDGKPVFVTQIATHHVMEDLGRVPKVNEWLEGLKVPTNHCDDEDPLIGPGRDNYGTERD